jgi:hypothetical protein
MIRMSAIRTRAIPKRDLAFDLANVDLAPAS